MSSVRRKGEHAAIALKKKVLFQQKTTGFECYDFVHCALPELDYNSIGTDVSFLGKELSFPLMVSAITGGFRGARRINSQLAEICCELNLAMGVGSQRPLLKNDAFLDTYQIVRQKMGNRVVTGNIGAAQIASEKSMDSIKYLVDVIEADAMTVHLNPLQELLQPEGNVNFKGVAAGLEVLVKALPVPVIVKEVGCGISRETAEKLLQCGVHYVDVAGSGGTSWAAIEGFRGAEKHQVKRFREWGIPTAKSLENVLSVPKIKALASGGIDNGVVMAKALAMGACLCGSALPVFRLLMKHQIKGTVSRLLQWKKELQSVLFLTGCETVADLQTKPVLIKE